MKTTEEKVEEIKEYIEDILEYDKYMQIKTIPHHYASTIFEHTVDVAYYSYKITKLLGFDYKSTVRAGMLHDFFLYDWRKVIPEEGLHGFVHPGIAYRNSIEKFELNKKEKDIILKHMFPLTIKPPMCIESWTVCMVDKFCATGEVVKFIYSKLASFYIRTLKKYADCINVANVLIICVLLMTIMF